MEHATPPVTEPAHEPIAADTLTIVTTVPRAATLPVDALPHASHMPARAVAVFHVKRFHTAASTTHAPSHCVICLDRMRASVDSIRSTGMSESSQSSDYNESPDASLCRDTTDRTAPVRVILTCGHVFHYSCIKTHVHHQNVGSVCPLCRTPIPFTTLQLPQRPRYIPITENTLHRTQDDICSYNARTRNGCVQLSVLILFLIVLLFVVQFIGSIIQNNTARLT